MQNEIEIIAVYHLSKDVRIDFLFLCMMWKKKSSKKNFKISNGEQWRIQRKEREKMVICSHGRSYLVLFRSLWIGILIFFAENISEFVLTSD